MARQKNRQRSQAVPLILILAGVVLILAVLVWAAVSGRGNTGGTTTTGRDIPYASIQRVSLADAKAAFEQKSAVFLDVRDESSYKASHIPGAVNIPLGNLESRLNELNRDQWIITYCT